MIVLEVCIVVLLIGLTGAALAGRIGGPMSDSGSSHAHRALPEGQVGPEEIVQLRFDQGLRGYRMDQVDQVLDRLATELDERDAQIAELRRAATAGAGPHDAARTGGRD